MSNMPRPSSFLVLLSAVLLALLSATAEAGWRISLGAAELRDFVRLGR